MSSKIAVLFPGIGYTVDKPLLYYSARLARARGFSVVPLPYGPFPPDVKGDPDKMRLCFGIAAEQSADMLRDVDWHSFEKILFISKSIGTVVALQYAEQYSLPADHLLFTPLEASFSWPVGRAAAFHGTADPWAETEMIERACREQGIPLYITEQANHSLETGDVERDLQILTETMEIADAFMCGN